MDKFNPVDMSVWQGRQDPEDGELALRWHDKVQPWPQVGSAAAGVALVGFACDEGVRRNKGRVGAAGAPLAVRKLLANSAWHLGQPVYDSGDVHCEDGDLDAAHGRLAERVASLLDEGHFRWYWVVATGGLRQLERPQPASGWPWPGRHHQLRCPFRPAHEAGAGELRHPFFQIAEQCAAQGTPFTYACLGVAETANTRRCLRAPRRWGCGTSWTRR